MSFEGDGYNPNDFSDQANQDPADSASPQEPQPEYQLPSQEPSNSEFVHQLYQDVLGRDGSLDVEGSNWWAGALEKGASREDVMQAFYNSEEYKASHSPHQESPPPEVILTADTEVSQWTQPGSPTPQPKDEDLLQPHLDDQVGPMPEEVQPNFGMMPQTVAENSAAVIETKWAAEEITPINETSSDEDFIRETYQNVLGRQADADGAGYWVQALENGHSREEVIAGFKDSEEYQALHPQQPAEQEPVIEKPVQSVMQNPVPEQPIVQTIPVQLVDHPIVHTVPAQTIAHPPDASSGPIPRSNGFNIDVMPLTDSRAVASLQLKPLVEGLVVHGDSAFKLQEGQLLINGFNGHGMEMGRVDIPGTVELGTNTDLKEIRANRNAGIVDAHNERLRTDEQYAADWYHTRALAGVAPVTKGFYDFADGILKRNGVDEGMTDPKVAHLVGYSDDKGVVVRVGSVFTNQLMDAYQNKWSADHASFMDKYGSTIVLGVMTAGIGSGLAAAAAANGGLLAGAVEVIGERAVAGLISSGLNGAITGNLNFESLAIAAVAGAATNGMTNTILRTELFSADTSALVARSLVNAGADLLQNGDLEHALKAGVSTVANNYIPIVQDVAREVLGNDAVKVIGQVATVANFVKNPVGAITGEINKAIDKDIHSSMAETSNTGTSTGTTNLSSQELAVAIEPKK
jgi:hypothetical protein